MFILKKTFVAKNLNNDHISLDINNVVLQKKKPNNFLVITKNVQPNLRNGLCPMANSTGHSQFKLVNVYPNLSHLIPDNKQE